MRLFLNFLVRSCDYYFTLLEKSTSTTQIVAPALTVPPEGHPPSASPPPLTIPRLETHHKQPEVIPHTSDLEDIWRSKENVDVTE